MQTILEACDSRYAGDYPSQWALDHARAKLTEAYTELQRVKALRPPYAPDWVDAMGRVPELMMPIVEEADEAEGET